jgi:chromosome segregation ATPase
MTEGLIKELDLAVNSDAVVAELKEEFPDASPEAIERAKQIEVLKHQVESLEHLFEQRQTARVRAVENALGDQIERVRRRAAALAVSRGTATEEEKQLLKDTNQDGSDSDDLAQFLSASTTHGDDHP